MRYWLWASTARLRGRIITAIPGVFLLFSLVYPAFSATSVSVSSGTLALSSGLPASPFASMGSFSFRIEGRVHNWGSGDLQPVCVLGLCIRTNTVDSSPGISTTIQFTGDKMVDTSNPLGVGGCCAPGSDIEYRIQRDLAKVNCPSAKVGCYTMEWWDVVNGTYNSYVALIASANSNWVALGSGAIYILPGVSVAWLEVYKGVVQIGAGTAYCGAAASGPCLPNLTDAQTGDLASYKFEQSLLDISGLGLSLSGGSVSYVTTPVYGPSCNAGTQQTVRAGDSGTLFGYGLPRDGVSTTVSYLWSQTAGPPSTITSPTSGTAIATFPTSTGVPGGPASYIFKLTTKDLSGNTTGCTVKDGAVTTDSNYVVQTGNAVTDQLIHKQLMWGAPTQPWPWYDNRRYVATEGILNHVYGLRGCSSTNINTCWFQWWWNRYGSGTITIADGSNIVTGTGTNFLTAYGCTAGGAPASGAPYIAIEYTGVAPTTLHYRMAGVLTCTDATHLVLDKSWSATVGTITGKYATDSTAQQYQWSINSFAAFPANFYDNVMALYAMFISSGIDDYYIAFQRMADAWWTQPTMDQGMCFGNELSGNPAGTGYCQGFAWRAHSPIGIVLRALDKGDAAPNGMWAGLRYMWDMTAYNMENYQIAGVGLVGNRENGVMLTEMALCTQFDPTFVAPSTGHTCKQSLGIYLASSTNWADPTTGGLYQFGGPTVLSANTSYASWNGFTNDTSSFGTAITVTNGSTQVTCVDHTNGGSGTCAWQLPYPGVNTDQLWVMNSPYSPAASGGGPVANADGDSVAYGIASVTDANHLRLSTPYAGPTASGKHYALYIGTSSTRGPVAIGAGSQPYMEGIVGDGLSRASTALALAGDSSNAAVARQLATSASAWNRNYAMEPGLGVWYLRGWINCPVTSGALTWDCTNGSMGDPNTDRILNAETAMAIQDEYLALGTPAAKSWVDIAMNAMWAKPGTCAGNPACNSDGNYVAAMDDGAYGMVWTSYTAPWKWYGQMFGSSVAPAWAATRLLTPTTPPSGNGPAVVAWSPSAVYAGSTGFTLTVTGANFATGAIVQWNGAALPTTYISAGRLKALVDASLITTAGTASITVLSGGQTSAAVAVAINAAAGLSIANQRVTAQIPPATGCVLPTSATSFLTTTATVYLYFEASLPSGVTLTNDWISPDGTAVSANRFTAVSPCYSAALPISGLPTDFLGAWQARVFANGNLLSSIPFTVTAPPPANQVRLIAVKNAASYVAGVVCPGEAVVLFGTGLGPAQLVKGDLSTSPVASQLANTIVQFDGVAAPILYTSATQISVVVPYGVSAPTTSVVVTYQGQSSPPLILQVQATQPALFTSDSSGTGQLAAVNQDGSMNGATTPAAAGSVVTLFGTGAGQTTPASQDGALAVVLPQPLAPVHVTINNVDATVLYAGGAPGEISGIIQINVQVPAGVSGAAVPLVLSIGDYSSPPGTTIAVAAAGDSTPQ